MCLKHGHDIRQLLEIKFQTVFSQIRDEYDQQCGQLITSIEYELSQMNTILQDINNKFDSSSISLSANESILSIIKQIQRIDVMTKNLEYDWQMITETSRKEFFVRTKYFL